MRAVTITWATSAFSASIKKGEEWYQISLGGNAGRDSSLAEIIGPSFSRGDVPDVIDKILEVYVPIETTANVFSIVTVASESSLSRSTSIPTLIKDGRVVSDD